MAYNSGTDKKKIVLLFLLIFILIGAGFLIVDFVSTTLGYNPPIPILRMIKNAAFRKRRQLSEDPYLLEREELSKEKERLVLVEERLINRENELKLLEDDAQRKMVALQEMERDLANKQTMLDNIDQEIRDRQNNIREQAIKLYNMPPSASVQLLERQSESDIVDILRAIDSYSAELGRASLSPYLISLMTDKDKAANVIRKFQYNAGGVETGVESIPDEELPPEP